MNTNSENPPTGQKVPCKWCGATILPATAEGTCGFCMRCDRDETVTYGLFYQIPSTSNNPTSSSDGGKVPCRFCGSHILPATALRTGGFCMPHSGHSRHFLDTLGGKPTFGNPSSQAEVLGELLNKESKQAIGLLFSIMLDGDELRLFSVKPQGDEPFFAESGVGLFRDGKCITGFVATWRANPHFDQDREEICSQEEIASAFGDEWQSIQEEIPEDATFVRFRTSPRSWTALCGRAGYAVKHNGEYLWQIVTMLN